MCKHLESVRLLLPADGSAQGLEVLPKTGQLRVHLLSVRPSGVSSVCLQALSRPGMCEFIRPSLTTPTPVHACCPSMGCIESLLSTTSLSHFMSLSVTFPTSPLVCFSPRWGQSQPGRSPGFPAHLPLRLLFTDISVAGKCEFCDSCSESS